MKLSQKWPNAWSRLAAIEQRDCDKPVTQTKADTSLVRYFRFYAGAGDKLPGDTIPTSTAG
jgi:aldehyde dehydrogenase (NAD+)